MATENFWSAAHAAAGSYFCQSRQKEPKTLFALAKPLGASKCTATTISLKTPHNSSALKQMRRFAALRATARHTPQAMCTPRGESASAERRAKHKKDKNMGEMEIVLVFMRK
jgi:hypothetical protein